MSFESAQKRLGNKFLICVTTIWKLVWAERLPLSSLMHLSMMRVTSDRCCMSSVSNEEGLAPDYVVTLVEISELSSHLFSSQVGQVLAEYKHTYTDANISLQNFHLGVGEIPSSNKRAT